MAGRIANKIIVVTGGSRGIGLGIAKQFMQRPGNRVIVTLRDINQISDDLRHAMAPTSSSSSSSLEVMELDTSKNESISTWAENLGKKVRHVDVLVNNAGVYGRRLALQEFEPSDFLTAFNVNSMGPFFVVQQMLKQGLLGHPSTLTTPSSTTTPSSSSSASAVFPSSLVVNISSIIASHGDQKVSSAAGGGYAYRASKAALNIINKSMALDLAPQGVECVLIHPGYVATDMTDYKGWISVDESTSGIIKVLEEGGSEGQLGKGINGRFFSYDGTEIPW